MTTGKSIAATESSPLLRPLLQLLLMLEDASKLLKADSLRVQSWKFALGHMYSAVCLAALANVGSSHRAIPGFWSCVQWLRLDYVALRLSEYTLYAVWTVLLVHLCALCVVSRKARVLGYLPLLSSLAAVGLDSPVFVMLLATAWSAFQPEYQTEMYSGRSAGQGWKAAVSMVIALSFCFIQYLRELHHSASNHSQVSTHLLARFSCHVDFLRISLLHLQEISYFGLSSAYPFLHLLLTAVCSAIIVAAYYLRVPYYRAFPNAVFCGCGTFVGIVALAVLLGEVVEARVFPAFGALLVAPVLAGMVFYHYRRGYYRQALKFYEDRLHKANLQVFQVELGLRRLLFLPSAQNSTVSLLLTQYDRLKDQRPKTILLWATDYALNMLQNEPLARLKLAQAGFVSSSFESHLLEQRLNQVLKLLHPPEPVEYLQYFQRITVVKQADQRLCHTLVAFYSQLASDLPDTKKICAYAQAMDQSIRFLKAEYRALVKDFPKAKEPPSLYASFLEDLMRVYDKAHTVRLRASVLSISNHRVEYAEYDSRVGFFSRGCGLVFASASPADLGVITYANEIAHMALGYSFGLLVGMLFTALIPAPYRLEHLAWVRDFLRTSVTVKHRHPSVLYLSHSQGYLVECVTNVVVTAASGPPMLLLCLKPTDSYKEVAIVTGEGVVAACSREFAGKIGVKDASVTGMKLDHLSPLLWTTHQRFPSQAYHSLSNPKSFCVFKDMIIGTKSVTLLFLVDTEAEAVYWSGSEKDCDSPVKVNYTSLLSLSITTSAGDYHRQRSDISYDSESPRVRRHEKRKQSVNKAEQSPRKEVQFSGAESSEQPPKRRPHASMSIISSGVQMSASTSNSSYVPHRGANLGVLSGLSHSFQLLKHTTLITVTPI